LTHHGTHPDLHSFPTRRSSDLSAEPGQSHAVVGDPQFVNPISDWHLQTGSAASGAGDPLTVPAYGGGMTDVSQNVDGMIRRAPRSEEHTSELQSLAYLVCRLLL